MNLVRPGFRRRFKVPRGSLGSADAPFTTALKVGQRSDGTRIAVAIVLGLAAHVSIPLAAWLHPAPPPAVVVERKEIPIVMTRPPPPKPPPPEPPKPKLPEVARHVRHTPPPPSQAAKVVSVKADPNQPLEMTGFAMPEGQADTYAGGETSAAGTSKKPVLEEVVKPHAPPAPPKASLARPPAKLSGDWNCAWPGEEEGSDRNAADATIDIFVSRDGEADDVKVVQAPNPNFAAAAKACPFQEHFQPALNDDGNPVAGVIHSFVIHFIR